MGLVVLMEVHGQCTHPLPSPWCSQTCSTDTKQSKLESETNWSQTLGLASWPWGLH